MKKPFIKKEIFEKNKKDENKKIFSKINSDPKKPLQNNEINFLSKSNYQKKMDGEKHIKEKKNEDENLGPKPTTRLFLNHLMNGLQEKLSHNKTPK